MKKNWTLTSIYDILSLTVDRLAFWFRKAVMLVTTYEKWAIVLAGASCALSAGSFVLALLTYLGI